MQKGKTLEFTCQHCQEAVHFTLFDLHKQNNIVACASCKKKYSFDDQTLLRQLKKFEALCRQIHDSEEILSSASVGITVGGASIKVPYRLLLARLSSILDLMIGDRPTTITFRIEPAEDLSSICESIPETTA